MRSVRVVQSLKPSELKLLHRLAIEPSTYQAELAKELGISRSAVNQVWTRLERERRLCVCSNIDYGQLGYAQIFGWAKSDQTTNPISQRTTSALKRLGLHSAGMSFYWLRHTFNTVAEQTGDQVAVRAIMGHVDDSMSANYRHEISEDRLRAVTDHVRQWLFELDGSTTSPCD